MRLQEMMRLLADDLDRWPACVTAKQVTSRSDMLQAVITEASRMKADLYSSLPGERWGHAKEGGD